MSDDKESYKFKLRRTNSGMCQAEEGKREEEGSMVLPPIWINTLELPKFFLAFYF